MKMDRKDVITVCSLVAIILITLLLAAYFNATSSEAINKNGKSLEDKYYLSGPDPYYNMRVVKELYETGHYPYWNLNDPDPLLDYPIGKANSRPPLFNMLFVVVAKFLSIFMNSVDAIGLSMQFLPSLYGALLVIPVYLIGKLLFNRKVGIIATLLIPLIPIHIGSGHGSAYSLADHDSFILLLGTTLYYFILKSLKEKDFKKSTILAGIAGVFLGMEVLSWAGAYFYFAFLAFYFVVMMFIDIIRYRSNLKNFSTAVTTMGVGFLVALPNYLTKGSINYMSLITFIIVLAFGMIYLFISKKKLPWVLTIPSILGIGLIVLAFLYTIRETTTNPVLLPFARFANHIFGGLAYVQKSKTYLTIAEASTFGISRTLMSFGPALYLIAWAGFLYLILWKNLIKKWDACSLFVTVWFLVEVYLTGSAGRFINDLVPLIAFLSAGIIGFSIEKANLNQMIKSLKNVRSWREIKKAVKLTHIFLIFFIAFIVVVPNAFLSLDAAVPSSEKWKVFGKGYQGAFGLSLYTEKYWEDAFRWLRNQDVDKDEEDRPAFISWWDYGFYCVAMGEHPTVADNFQSGIPAAGNFHIAQSEKEAISVLIVRLVQGCMLKNGGKVPQNIREILGKYLGNNSTKIVDIFEDPLYHRNTSNSSFGKIIGKEYGGKKYRVREENAMYHDGVKFLTDHLNEEEIVMLYRDLQSETGWSIRYYGVEGYDVNIFNVFTFLSDKGIFGYETLEDDFFYLRYIDRYGKTHTPEEVEELSKTLNPEDFRNLELRPIVGRKDPFYNSMVYKVYFGITPKAMFDLVANGTLSFAVIPFLSDNSTDPFGPGNYYYQPTAGLKHFVIKYLSPLNLSKSLYFHRGSLCLGMPAVVIAKYYEGAKINGTLKCMDKPLSFVNVLVRDDFKQTLQMKLLNGRIVNRTIEKIPHDYSITDLNGKFSLIAPAGNITLSFIITDGIHRYTLKEITFNGSTDDNLRPISEEEAMRVPGINYNRTINVTIKPSNLSGFVFNYNQKPLSNVSIKIKDQIHGNEYNISTNESGFYRISNVFPSIYELTVDYRGFEIHKNLSLFLAPGENYYNVSEPKPSSVRGIVYYDKNGNQSYDRNEEMKNVNVNLIYRKSGKVVKSYTTSDNGTYYFRDIIPGDYMINATLINESTGYPDYNASVEFSLGENETMFLNISLELAKIKVYGQTIFNNTSISNLTIDFRRVEIENNTAKSAKAKSNETGYYTVYLSPGVYNVSAEYEFTDANNETIKCYFRGTLVLKRGQSPLRYDITLVRRK